MAAPANNRHSAKWLKPGLLYKALLHARKGVSRTDMFKLVGVHPDTGFMWLRNAREKPEDYPELVKFLGLLERAEASFNKAMVSKVTEAALTGGPRAWPAAMTLLERRDPENWGKRDKVALEAGDTPLFQLNQVVLVDDEAREVSRDLLRRVAANSAYEPVRPSVRGELTEGGSEES